ncbi:MAG: carbon-nitrogen hydrolase family protein [Phycisphaerae bacterium]|nr:carbon-nitrogen hydrolase family protein [Phycisphaerae bacterium]
MKRIFRPAILIVSVCLVAAAPAEADRPTQAQTKPGRNRLVRVVTITQANLRSKDQNVFDATLVWLNRAASFNPDIACLPETFPRKGAETVPGPTTEKLAEWAREHSCYVICPLKTKVRGKVYNSAILLDRGGKIVGRYDKMHLTEGELRGMTPGQADPPVFKTDFGTIGIQICFDVNWRDTWRRLKDKGAEIVFWPSAYPADRQLSALAWMNRFYVVSSTWDRFASIYDIAGDTIATTGRFQGWAGAALSLDKRLFEIDYHVSKMRKIQAKYGERVKVTWLHPEDWVTLESLDETLSVDDLIAEYKLTPLDKYHARCKKAIDQARKKNKTATSDQ